MSLFKRPAIQQQFSSSHIVFRLQSGKPHSLFFADFQRLVEKKAQASFQNLVFFLRPPEFFLLLPHLLMCRAATSSVRVMDASGIRVPAPTSAFAPSSLWTTSPPRACFLCHTSSIFPTISSALLFHFTPSSLRIICQLKCTTSFEL